LDRSAFRRNVVENRRYPSLAHALRAEGYDTAFCGKSHLGPPKDYGFDAGGQHGDLTDADAFAFSSDFVRTRTTDQPPFLLWIATHQPHIPLQPQSRRLDRYAEAEIEVDPNFRETPPEGSLYNQGLPGETYYRDSDVTNNPENVPAGPPRTRDQTVAFIRAYYAVISQLDHQVGQLVETLRATGLYDDTVIVFLSDNGYFLGNHGLGNKIAMLEESVRVPMFMRGPGIPAGVRSESLVSSLDLYPTLVELAGGVPPGHLAGASLKPLFATPDATLRSYVASECVGVGGKPGMGHRMVCNRRWKYILTGVGEEALFDLESDPYEMVNVVSKDSNQAVLAELRACLRDWMRQTGDTHAPPPGPASP
jgi:arylsulfatase A-like enzyme